MKPIPSAAVLAQCLAMTLVVPHATAQTEAVVTVTNAMVSSAEVDAFMKDLRPGTNQPIHKQPLDFWKEQIQKGKVPTGPNWPPAAEAENTETYRIGGRILDTPAWFSWPGKTNRSRRG